MRMMGTVAQEVTTGATDRVRVIDETLLGMGMVGEVRFNQAEEEEVLDSGPWEAETKCLPWELV